MTLRRIAVTGGAGFIGHHLVRTLLAGDCTVLAIDNCVRGGPKHLPHDDRRLSLLKMDIRDNGLLPAVAEFQPDAIFHLAANHFIPDCIQDPVGTVGVNVLGTQNLLTIAESARVPRFVFASTADVYASSTDRHAEESPIGSSNIYGVSKFCAESLVALAQKRVKTTKFTIARLFNVYGPEETNPHVIPDILQGLKAGGPLRLGDLEPIRDYIYVADVVDVLIRLGQYDDEAMTFNVASGNAVSVRGIIRTAEGILGRRIEVSTDPAKLRKTDRFSLTGNNARAVEKLNWKPAFSLESGFHTLLVAEGLI